MEFMISTGFSNVYARGCKDNEWIEIYPEIIFFTNGTTVCHLKNYNLNKMRMFWYKFLNVCLLG